MNHERSQIKRWNEYNRIWSTYKMTFRFQMRFYTHDKMRVNHVFFFFSLRAMEMRNKKRDVGSMISSATWTAMNYWIFKLQERWPIFVDPAQKIYEWMIVWEHLKWWDMTVNLTINKQQTSVRNSGNDEAMILKPIRHMSLEDALWYIGLDELVEVTPQSIRIRKKYLTELERTTARRQWKI